MRAMKLIEGKTVSQAELKIISSIDHENVIKYFDHFEIGISNGIYLSFITEYCEVSCQKYFLHHKGNIKIYEI